MRWQNCEETAIKSLLEMDSIPVSMRILAAILVLALAETSFALNCSLSGNSTICRLDATEDVFVYNSYNQNHYNFLIAGIHPYYPLKRTLLKFEEMPSNCQEIRKAKMYVYYWYAHKASALTEAQVPFIPRPIQARQVLKSWTETQVTQYVRFPGAPWSQPYLGLNNTDAKSDVDDTQTVSRNTSSGYIAWDITTTARNWHAGQPNNGILLSVLNEDKLGREIRFFSRERSPNRRPYLEITCTSRAAAGGTNTTDNPTGSTAVTDATSTTAPTTTSSTAGTDAHPRTDNCSLSGNINVCHLDVIEDVSVLGESNKNRLYWLRVGGGYRTLLKFEDIPSSCQEIEAAEMCVYHTLNHQRLIFESYSRFTPNHDLIQARQVLKSWQETQVTRDVRFPGAPWSKPLLGLDNTDAKSDIDDTQTVYSYSAGYYTWDITTTARNWLAGQPNNGILLSLPKSVSGGYEIYFHRRETGINTAAYLEVKCTSHDMTGGTGVSASDEENSGVSAVDFTPITTAVIKNQELGLLVPVVAVGGGLVALILVSVIVIAMCVVLGMQKSKKAVERHVPNNTQQNVYSPTSALDDNKKEVTFNSEQTDLYAIGMTGFEKSND